MPQLRAIPEAPFRAIGLVRVSKVGDRGEDLISPELQRRAIEDHAHRRGATIVEWVEALDESASASRSPWWARLDKAIATIEAGDADAIIVWKLSRAARHRRRWAVALDRVEVAGGFLESATEGFDATTSTGKLSRGILAELAAWESDVKSEQWKEAHSRRYRLGLPHTTLHIFGYSWDPKAGGYRIDPATRAVIEHLYSDYASGVRGFTQLVRYLNDRGVRSGKGNLWSVSTLLRYMDGGFAAGLLPVGAARKQLEHRPGAHPPIISPELWEAYWLRRNRMRQIAPRRRQPRYHLSGLVVCFRCLAPMSGYPYSKRGEEPRQYYRCSTYQNTRSCRGVYTAAAPVDLAVRQFLTPLAEDAATSAAAKAATQAARARHDDDILMLTRELDALKVRGQKMLDRLDAGVIDDTDYRTWRADRDDQATRLEAAIGVARAEQAQLARQPTAKDVADVLAGWDAAAVAAPGELGAWLATLIDRVIIYPATVIPRVKVVARWENTG